MRGGRWWRWLPAVLSAATGCTMLMGIDGEYTERAAGMGGGGAAAAGGGGTGGAGGGAGVGGGGGDAGGCALPTDCLDTPGDCQAPTCEGGVCAVMPDDQDVPADDGNACTSVSCVRGMVVIGLQPPGTACGGGGAGGGGGDGGGAGGPVCDGTGSCVECLTTADCVANMSCVSGICVPMCEDGVMNGGETDVDCGGSTPCPRCAAGMTCQDGGDCVSGFCSQGTDTCL